MSSNSRNLQDALADVQSKLDSHAESESVSEGAYVNLSNALKHVSEALDNDRKLAMVQQYVDMVMFDPQVVPWITPNVFPLDADVMYRVLKQAEVQRSHDDHEWWDKLMLNYANMILNLSRNLVSPSDRRQIFIDLLIMCNCEMHPRVVSGIRKSGFCFVCCLQATHEETNYENSHMRQAIINTAFIRNALAFCPRLITLIDACCDRATHNVGLRQCIERVRESALNCDWNDDTFSNTMRFHGFRGSKRQRNERQAAHAGTRFVTLRACHVCSPHMSRQTHTSHAYNAWRTFNGPNEPNNDTDNDTNNELNNDTNNAPGASGASNA